MNNIFITTTGLTPSIILNDVGERIFTHPLVNYNIGLEFTYNELLDSIDFNNALNSGYLTASYNGSLITNSTSFQPVIISNLIGATGATGPQGATGSQGPIGATGSRGSTGSVFLNGLTSSLQFFTSSNDTNVRLNIVSSGSTHSYSVSWNGILPVSRGGSGTSSSFTPGSVLFAGPGGQYYQDNPNLFWNDSLNRLSIGTNSTATASLTIADGIQLGFGLTSATIASTNELVLRQDGDTFGSSILRLRNRNGENGAIYETTNPSITLVDFIFKSAINQRNIRFESRTASTFLGTSPEFQFGQAANPSLVINDREVSVIGGTFSITNTNKTFRYQFLPSNISTNRTITIPLLTSNDVLTFQSFSQSLTNKTLLSTNNNIIDATHLRGRLLTTDIPNNNQIIYYDSNNSTFKYKSPFGDDFDVQSNSSSVTTTSGSGYASGNLTTIAHQYSFTASYDGSYRFGVKFNYAGNSITNSVKFRWYVDGTAATRTIEIELKDTTDDVTWVNFIHTDLTSGTHSIQLRYATEASNSVTVSYSEVEFWRTK